MSISRFFSKIPTPTRENGVGESVIKEPIKPAPEKTNHEDDDVIVVDDEEVELLGVARVRPTNRPCAPPAPSPAGKEQFQLSDCIGFVVVRIHTNERRDCRVILPLTADGILEGIFAHLPGFDCKDCKPATKLMLPPLELSVLQMKLRNPRTVLFVESGYRYRLFCSDAVIAGSNLGIYPWQPGRRTGSTSKARTDNRCLVTASVPTGRVMLHASVLADKGYQVGIVEQMETAAVKRASLGSSGSASGLFARDLTKVFTGCTMQDSVVRKVAGGKVETHPAKRPRAMNTDDSDSETRLHDEDDNDDDDDDDDLARKDDTTDIMTSQFQPQGTRCIAAIAAVDAPVHAHGPSMLISDNTLELTLLETDALTVRTVSFSGENAPFKLLQALQQAMPRELVVQGCVPSIVNDVINEYISAFGYPVVNNLDIDEVFAVFEREKHKFAGKPLNNWRSGTYAFEEVVSTGKVALRKWEANRAAGGAAEVKVGLPIRFEKLGNETPLNSSIDVLRTYFQRFHAQEVLDQALSSSGSLAAAPNACVIGQLLEDCDILASKSSARSLLAIMTSAAKSPAFRPSAQAVACLQGWLSQPLCNADDIVARQGVVSHLLSGALKDVQMLFDDRSSVSDAWKLSSHPGSADISLFTSVLAWVYRVALPRCSEDTPVWLSSRVQACSAAISRIKALNLLQYFASDAGEALADAVVTALSPDFTNWQKMQAEATTALNAELTHIRQLLNMPGLTWKSLRTSPTRVVEYVVELERARIESPLFPLSIPPTWKELVSTTKYKRYHTPGAMAALEKLELSQDMQISCREIAWRKWANEHIPTLAKDHLRPMLTVFTELETACILAAYSMTPGMAKPHVAAPSEKSFVALTAARNPILHAHIGDACLPTDIMVGYTSTQSSTPSSSHSAAAGTTTVITGPNAGGKSTCLRTLLTCVIVAQTGCYVPATNMAFTPFQAIGCWMQKADKLLFGLSSFGAEVRSMQACLAALPTAKNALFVFDEPVSATDATDGAALACAFVRSIVRRQQTCDPTQTPLLVLSTHYPAVAMQHKLGDVLHPSSAVATHTSDAEKPPATTSLPWLAPWHMEYLITQEAGDKAAVVMLYRLKPGVASDSFGLQLALDCGIPSSIVTFAKAHCKQLQAEWTNTQEES